MIASLAAAAASTLALGLANQPGDTAHARADHVTWRYQYLTGGVNRPDDWTTWNPDGTFVSRYVSESKKAHMVPVFSYYELLDSHGPADGAGEQDRDLANLADPGVMTKYYDNLRTALTRAHAAAQGSRVVLHVEPDLWGYVEQKAGATDDPNNVPAAVASTNDPQLQGLPDTAAGFAQAIVRLRDQLAPEVQLGYHLSTWGTNTDPTLQDPSLRQVDGLTARSAKFYNNLHARFDLVFSDPSDRDDGFDRVVNGDHGRGRWTAGDYARDERWLKRVHQATRLPIVMWQIPLGNTNLPDRPGRYQDTHVQTLLGPDSTTRRAYRDAGVIAFLFGGGADGTTSERTDGGLFQRLAARYAHARLRTS